MANYNHIVRQLEQLRDDYMDELRGNGDDAAIALFGGVPTPVNVAVLARIRGEVSAILAQYVVPGQASAGTTFVVPELDDVIKNFEEQIADYHLDPTGNTDTNYQAIQDEISNMNDELIEAYPLSDVDENEEDSDDDVTTQEESALSPKEKREELIRNNAAAAAAAAAEESRAAAEEEDDESPTKRRKTEGGSIFHQPTSMYNIAKYGQLH